MFVVSDCYQGSQNAQYLYCVDKCPISFYAVSNHTTTMKASTATTTTTTTTTTSGTTQPGSTTTTTTTPTPSTTTGKPVISSTTATSPTPEGTSVPPTANVTCAPCGTGCAQCVDNHVCTLCLPSYELVTDNGTCVRGGEHNSLLQALADNIVVSITVVLCVLSVLIFVMVFGILQLLDSDYCLARKGRIHRKDVEIGGIASSEKSKIKSMISNGVSYDKRANEEGTSLLNSTDSD